MTRTEVLDVMESILKEAGFDVSEKCCSRPSCFDIAARREKQLALFKVQTNIGSTSFCDAFELQTISSYFSAVPLIIGEKARNKPLEDDTVYSRYDIYALTPKTFRDIVVEKMYPLIGAGPGGYYVRLDGDLIKKRRQKLGLSVGKMAEMIGISRRTLYGYEKGMAKASVSVAYKLEWILGVPLVQPIDVFQSAPGDTGFFARARRVIARHGMMIKQSLIQKVLRKLSQFNFVVTSVGKAPFDFMAKHPNKELKIIGGIAHKKERDMDKRATEIVSVSRIVEFQPILITDGKKVLNNDILSISQEDLMKIKTSEELFTML